VDIHALTTLESTNKLPDELERSNALSFIAEGVLAL